MKIGKGLIGLLIVVVILFIGGATLLSHRNTAVDLEERISAQYTSNKSNYDNMWKKFKELVQVTDIQATQMKEVYTGLISGRYNDTNLLFKMVKEDNPKMDTTLYSQIQREITAGRNQFDNNQKAIADQIREYNSYIRKKFIMSAITGRKPKNADEYVVTSERTQNAFETKKDDEINLKGK